MSIIPDTLLQTSVLGAVLVWFMVRLEGIIKENTKVQHEMKENFIKMYSRLCELIDK